MPWITGPILHLIKKKNSVRKKLKSSPSNHLKEKFKHLRAKVKRLLRESRDNFFDSLESMFKSNPKRFWSILKYKSQSKNIPDVISTASAVRTTTNVEQSLRTISDNAEDISNMFNNYFTSVFTTDNLSEDSTSETSYPTVTELSFSANEVQTVLDALEVTKATGPDEIPARLLKETSYAIASSLCSSVQ